MKEGGWRTAGMCRSCDDNNHKCHGGQRQGGQHLGRLAVYIGPVVVCTLSGALQTFGAEILALHCKQMDVYLGNAADMAVYIWSYHKHQLRHRTNEHMVGDGVRYILRYLPGIHLYDDGTKDVAAYCGKRVQLCAAYCVGKRKRCCRPCRI